ncbi:VOC family protein [Pseudooceanicola atlanticus]|uniref:Dioxygenase n=1 Tax=Pseudooceanicola atlanticus TaxID=1461694 RepID=A0A0A0ECU8_9RHOB|nr:VOC family protein [Pseudooceanicola atlanticus]KGM48776.1 dioxygenase [Pseudooceanicola atlanticus]
MIPPFHLAIHVTSLEEARDFYGTVLGAEEGRSTETWVDFDLFGHQLSLHLGPPFATTDTGKVGEHMVPMPHFGFVLPLERWQEMAERLKAANVAFVLEPSVRFEGEPGEQWTMFFRDPSGNPIEIKGFRDYEGLFAKG